MKIGTALLLVENDLLYVYIATTLNRREAAELWPAIKRFAETGWEGGDDQQQDGGSTDGVSGGV